MFVIVKNMEKQGGEKNMRLCNDNMWRGWCHFGTYPECVKEYRSRGWADRTAKKLKAEVVEIPRGQAMTVAGQIEHVDH